MPRPKARPWRYVGVAGQVRRPRGWLSMGKRFLGLFSVKSAPQGTSPRIRPGSPRLGTPSWRELLVWLAATVVGGAFLVILWHYQWGLALAIAVLWLGWSGWEFQRRVR